MKLLSALVLAALAAVSGTATAAVIDNPTVGKKTVRYSCQQGKNVKVTYGFNKQGLPTYASFATGHKKHKLPINLARSDISGTFFGKEGGYLLSTDYLDTKSYRKAAMMITAPDNELIYKDCTPRR